MNKVTIPKLIVALIWTFFFMYFEFVFWNFLMLSSLVLNIVDIIFWTILSFSMYFLFLYLIISVRQFVPYFSIIFMLLSFTVLGFYVLFYTYNLIDTIIFVIFISSIFVFLILNRIGIEMIIWIRVAFFITIFVSGFFTFYYYITQSFAITKIIFIVIGSLTLYTTYYSIKYYGMAVPHRESIFNNDIIKIILIITPIISSLVLLVPVRGVMINPDTEPEIIFWTSASTLPDDPETLEICKEYNIGFDVVMRAQYFDDNRDEDDIQEFNESLQILKDAGVEYGISMGGDDDFYLSLDNAKNYLDEFNVIRDWLIENELYEDARWVDFDVEAPKDVFATLEGQNESETYTEQFIDNLPTREEIEEAEDVMNDLIDLIHDDDKEAGIIYNPLRADICDGDDDYNYMLRTIYGLNLDWDFSVCMLYRTQQYPSIVDAVLDVFEGYSAMSDYEIEYYNYTEENDKFTLPISEYYYRLGMELMDDTFNIPMDDRYMFIGSFDHDYKDTTYIKEEEYLIDIDINRHFEREKIWMYYWSSWKARYGESELEDLGEFVRKHKSWRLNFPGYTIQREVLFGMAIPIVDMFLFLDFHIFNL